ncbi:thioredoxin family protein [Lolliginicoccus suaedae]|uniref:thioredoxin family protein n=1 Tax=Lolliginicoccus suaedae TaxID=2605429 RepID=UPI0011EE1A96|nr:thioredoxin family protein [Lolliginicoccus suaedae]
MTIEILHVPHCPHVTTAEQRLHEAHDRLGLPRLAIVRTELASEPETRDHPFAGSPTILINGRDVIPGAPRVHQLACRIYRTTAGPDGAPSVDQVIESLRAGESP